MSYRPNWVNDEMSLSNIVKKRDVSNDVKKIQEWLNYDNYKIKIDGIYGNATSLAARQFFSHQHITLSPAVLDGEQVDLRAFLTLCSSLGYINIPIGAGVDDFTTYLLKVVERHLSMQPIEIGGQNMGPWVRTYMKGNEGTEWPWCAGFVSFILHQAYENYFGKPFPFGYYFAVRNLVKHAKDLDAFISGDDPNIAAKIKPGFLFVNRKYQLLHSVTWSHIGFVTDTFYGDKLFQTAEGNTNDQGSREGYTACKRFRNFDDKDFIDVSKLHV